MRKKQKKENKLPFSDTAPGALTGYLQGTPPAQNPPIQRNYTQGALQDRVNAEIGCVIGREHARDPSQHASGASGPGRILSCLRQHARPGPRKVRVPTV